MTKYLVCVVLLACPLLGSMGSMLVLDGQDDYVTLFKPVIDVNYFTVEGWAYLLGPGGGVYNENFMFEQRSLETGFAATSVVLAPESYGNNTSFVVRDNKNDRVRTFVPMQNYLEWHHYAGVCSEEWVSLYVDGELKTRLPNFHTGNYVERVDIIDIGRHVYHDIISGFFNGYIDEIRIWDHPRSPEQIQEFMTTSLPKEVYTSPNSGLLGFWNFDETIAATLNGQDVELVKDLSGHQHHGVLKHGATILPKGPRTLTLVEFDLITPRYDSTIYTTRPVFSWEPAVQETVVTPFELEYTLFLSTSPDFFNPKQKRVLGTQHSVQLTGLQPGTTYFWKVSATNAVDETRWSRQESAFFVHETATPVEDNSNTVPDHYKLYASYPNPFNATTAIQYDLPQSASVRLLILNIHGQLVRTLVDHSLPTGSHFIRWNGRTDLGETAASGVYMCKLKVQGSDGGTFSQTNRLTLLR